MLDGDGAIIKHAKAAAMIPEAMVKTGYGNKTAWQEVKRRIPNIYEKLTSSAIVKNEYAYNDTSVRLTFEQF